MLLKQDGGTEECTSGKFKEISENCYQKTNSVSLLAFLKTAC